jgi:hypothetical protein
VSNPILTKKRVLLDRKAPPLQSWFGTDDRQVFTSEADERIVPQVSLLLDSREWVALGEPDQITVTIRPGDRLNPA